MFLVVVIIIIGTKERRQGLDTLFLGCSTVHAAFGQCTDSNTVFMTNEVRDQKTLNSSYPEILLHRFVPDSYVREVGQFVLPFVYSSSPNSLRCSSLGARKVATVKSYGSLSPCMLVCSDLLTACRPEAMRDSGSSRPLGFFLPRLSRKYSTSS